jgi:type I restriction enzyme, S subunit
METLRRPLLEDLLTLGVPGWHTKWTEVPVIGRVPANWTVVRLGEVARVQTGRALSHRSAALAAQKAPYLTVANVKDGYLDLSVIRTMRVSTQDLDRYRLRVGDVLFTEGGDADKLGRGTVWQGEIDVCLHQNHIFVVRPELPKLLPAFLAGYAAGTAGKRYFLGAAKQTTNLASINSSQLLRMPIPLPPIEEQRRIVGLIGTHTRVLRSLRDERNELLRLRSLTADAMLAGQLRIPGWWEGSAKEETRGPGE